MEACVFRAGTAAQYGDVLAPSRKLLVIESEIIAYKTLNGLAPLYLCDFFTRNSTLSSHSLHNTETDLRVTIVINAKCTTSI